MAENSFASANTHFAAKLFGEITAHQPQQNMLISPLSIGLALLLAHAGAAGATAQAIADVLALGPGPHDHAMTEAGALMRQLGALDTGEGGGEAAMLLRIANALFVNTDVALNATYARRCRAMLEAEIAALDFGAPSAAATIDRWVSERTRGRIDEIAGQLDRRTVAVLLNAVYFKAAWQLPFLEQATRPDQFNCADGQQISVPMMANQDRYLYQRADGFEVVGLPFRGAGDLRLLVLLPSRGRPISALQQQLATPAAWASIAPRPALVRLRMPRFRIACDLQLNEPLAALGMGVAFDPTRADFSAMRTSKLPFAISEVRHKTYLDVNEHGAEAAAVTAIKMTRMSMVVERPIDVTVDRPFVCAIQAAQSSALLFVGSIASPRVLI